MALKSNGSGNFSVPTNVNEALGDLTFMASFFYTGTVNYAHVIDKEYNNGFALFRNATLDEHGSAVLRTAPPLADFVSTTNNTWYRCIRRRIGTAGMQSMNGSRTTDTVPTTATSTARMYIGSSAGGSGSFNVPGYITRVAVWNVGLTDGEFTALENGWNPMKIRPQSLIWYSPFMNHCFNIFGSKVNGTGSQVYDTNNATNLIRF